MLWQFKQNFVLNDHSFFQFQRLSAEWVFFQFGGHTSIQKLKAKVNWLSEYTIRKLGQPQSKLDIVTILF